MLSVSLCQWSGVFELTRTGKLTRVISGHMGWVRAVAVDPGNQWFATGAGDRVVKVSLFFSCEACADAIDLGSGFGRIEAVFNWSYFDHPWSCCLRPTPLPVLLC
jgi:WD40 repeat protein